MSTTDNFTVNASLAHKLRTAHVETIADQISSQIMNIQIAVDNGKTAHDLIKDYDKKSQPTVAQELNNLIATAELLRDVVLAKEYAIVEQGN